MLSPEERIRRVRIIDEGVKSAFWRTLRESLEYYIYEQTKEVVSLHGLGKEKEAHELAIHVQALQRFIQEPAIILRHNKGLIEKAKEIIGAVIGR